MLKNSTAHPGAKVRPVELDEPLFERVHRMFSTALWLPSFGGIFWSPKSARISFQALGAKHPLLGRMYLPVCWIGTEIVAQLRRLHPANEILSAIYRCSSLVDVVIIGEVLKCAHA